MTALWIIGWALLGILSIGHLTSPIGLYGLILFGASGGIGAWLGQRGGVPFTEGEVFFASRWSSRNLIFPTQVAVLTRQVIRHKERLVGAEEEAIAVGQIASVKVESGLLWSKVLIESTGGADPIVCQGHPNADAQRIKTLIVEYQEALHTERIRSTAPAEDDRAGTPLDVLLMHPNPEPGCEPEILSRLTCHLPACAAEAGLEAVVTHLLQLGPADAVIRITRHTPGHHAEGVREPSAPSGQRDLAFPPRLQQAELFPKGA